jgi:hypothetical protein
MKLHNNKNFVRRWILKRTALVSIERAVPGTRYASRRDGILNETTQVPYPVTAL